jgi:hypothetical protein
MILVAAAQEVSVVVALPIGAAAKKRKGSCGFPFIMLSSSSQDRYQQSL